MFKKHLHIIFLVVATLLTLSLYFCDVYTVIEVGGVEYGEKYTSNLICLLLLIMTTIADLVIFALNKFGFVQARVCIFNAIMLAGLQLVLLWYYFTIHEASVIFSPTILFPALASFLNAVAGRRIMVTEIAYTAARKLGSSKSKASGNVRK